MSHWFPGFTRDRMIELALTDYVAMHEFVEKSLKAAGG